MKTLKQITTLLFFSSSLFLVSCEKVNPEITLGPDEVNEGLLLSGAQSMNSWDTYITWEGDIEACET
jgi:hypothetical protein